jgi:hypothetical protein
MLGIIRPGFENLITIPGSEPLLAEVAHELVQGTQKSVVRPRRPMQFGSE